MGVEQVGPRERDPIALLELLARAGESSGPSESLDELRVTLGKARKLLEVEGLELRAEISDRGRTLMSFGSVGSGSCRELPLRGAGDTGVLRVFGGPLDEVQLVGLRAVAAFCSLAVEAVRASEAAATRAAHVSVVQLASEALGTILDEEQLYKTVLVLTLELMQATGGAVVLEDGTVIQAGDGTYGLEELGRVVAPERETWLGRIGGYHAVGVPVGREGGALFLVRGRRPYTTTEGVSLKLVARQLARARERSRLYAEREQVVMDTIAALAATVEMRDGTTGEHIRRTQDLAVDVAEELGLASDSLRIVRYAAVLHDVGKVGIPDAILRKTGGLDEDEWVFMRRHPEIGAEIVATIEGFDEVSEIILSHHERFDGDGYPAGISGLAIPIEARIIAAIDTYDAMTNDRPYRAAMSHETAVAELVACSGTQFDPNVVEALGKVLHGREEEYGG